MFPEMDSALLILCQGNGVLQRATQRAGYDHDPRYPLPAFGQTMLTIDDVRAIPLFSTLAVTELERLAQTSADLHLGAGEFAVHEGGERALFAVLSGKIEVVKLIEGIEKTLGWRVPGTIFGEVPIAFGTPFPGGYRASEPSRVMRVDPRQYYAIAAASPEISVKVGNLARERSPLPDSTRRPLLNHGFLGTPASTDWTKLQIFQMPAGIRRGSAQLLVRVHL